MKILFLICLSLLLHWNTNAEKCACLHWYDIKESRCLELDFFEKILQNVSISNLEITSITIEEKPVCTNLSEETRGGWSGSIDVTHNKDGSSSLGGSIKTPLFSASGHVHTSPDGHVTGGDGGVSVGNGLVSGGVHGSYDKGKGVSGGVHASVGVPGLNVGGSVDVNSHGQLSGGASATLGGSTLGGTVDKNGLSTSIGSSIPLGKRNGRDEKPDDPTPILNEVGLQPEDVLVPIGKDTHISLGGSLDKAIIGVQHKIGSGELSAHVDVGGSLFKPNFAGAGVGLTQHISKDTSIHGNLDFNGQGHPSFGLGIDMKFGRRVIKKALKNA